MKRKKKRSRTRATWAFMLAGACAAGCGRDEPPPAPAAAAPRSDGPAAPDADVEPDLPARAPAALGPELAAIFGLIEQFQTGAARPRLRAWLEQHPGDGRAEFLVGLSFHREKRYGLARPHFVRAAELEPSYHPTYHFLGWCLYWLGDLPAARQAFETHLAWLPGEGDSHFAIGLIDLDEDRLDEAERRFRDAIRLQAEIPARRKDVSKAHARLADIHVRRGELEAARTDLVTATTLWPEHYTAFYKLFRVHTRLGAPEAAREALEQYRIYEKIAEERRGVPEPGP